jgi:TonB family protein
MEPGAGSSSRHAVADAEGPRQRPRRGSLPPGPPRAPVYTTLRPLPLRHNHLLPAALIFSSILHMVALVLFVMHPASRQRPALREPMMVKLIELPAGIGGATTGTPGKTNEAAPPKVAEPPKPTQPPKLTLPGKVPPKPKEGPAPIRTEKPGQAVGLGHGGPAGLGGKSAGVILDEPTFQYEWYKARLEDALKSNWRKPVQPGAKTLSASVHFLITAAGRADDVQIVSSSGSPAFDQSVLRAVYDSAPFPKFPPQYDAPNLGVLYTFELTPEK